VKGLVFQIYRGTTHDGPGLRTTIFLKGCALNCLWCHNPEGISVVPEIIWDSSKCIGCRNCLHTCKSNAIDFTEKGIRLLRERCELCYECTYNCPSKALKVCGNEWESNVLVEAVLADKMFYEEFEGGVTVSGGEPLMQSDFLLELLTELQHKGINTILDTSGYARKENFAKVLPYVQGVLFDIKILDDEQHKLFTNVSNRLILENLRYLVEQIRFGLPCKLWVRTPLIPGVTSCEDNIHAIGNLMKTEMNDAVDRWELCTFNNVCKTKYKMLQRKWKFEDYPLMSKLEADKMKKIAEEYMGNKVILSGIIGGVKCE